MKKYTIAFDIAPDGKGGGPYNSTNRILNSELKKKYNLKVIKYDTSIGKGVSIKRIYDIYQQIREAQPDILHFTGLQLSGFHIIIAAKLARVPHTVVVVRGMTRDMIYFSSIKRAIVSYIIEPLTLLLVDKYYGNSIYTTNRRLLQAFRHKLHGHIYNLPPTPLEQSYKLRIGQELNLDKSAIIVTTVARINKEKGYHIYTRAIKLISKKKDVIFLIVGNGSYLDEMKKALSREVEQKKVLILGYRSDIREILKASDIFVLPTLHETLSMALLEASVAGLALVASKTGGIPEIVKNGQNGYLVPPGDEFALAEAIVKLIEDSSLRKRCSVNAKILVERNFPRSKILDELDNLYKSILSLDREVENEFAQRHIEL